MRYALIALYLLGWLLTTVALFRATPTGDARGRRHAAALKVVGGLCAVALAAVWPLSGLLLPLIRGAVDGRE